MSIGGPYSGPASAPSAAPTTPPPRTELTKPGRPPLPPPAVPLPMPDAVPRKRSSAELSAARKRPLPPNVGMVRYRKRVALLEAYPGQLVLRTSPTSAVAYAAAAARRGHLIAGRIVLTDPDGTRHKLRAWEAGAHAPIELGDDNRTSFGGGSGFDLGDDPISAIIALVLVVLFLIALPVLIVLWLRRRWRRARVAKRMLLAAQPVTAPPL